MSFGLACQPCTGCVKFGHCLFERIQRNEGRGIHQLCRVVGVPEKNTPHETLVLFFNIFLVCVVVMPAVWLYLIWPRQDVGNIFPRGSRHSKKVVPSKTQFMLLMYRHLLARFQTVVCEWKMEPIGQVIHHLLNSEIHNYILECLTAWRDINFRCGESCIGHMVNFLAPFLYNSTFSLLRSVDSLNLN